MHQTIFGMVEANRQWHNKQKSSLNHTIRRKFVEVEAEEEARNIRLVSLAQKRAEK